MSSLWAIRDWSPQQNHNLSIRGGSDKIKYYGFLGYLDQGSMWKKNGGDYKRYNFQSNIDAKILDNLSLQLDIEALGKNADDDAFIAYNKTIHKDELDAHIAKLIQKKIEAGFPEHEICVLAPTWYMVIPMGRKLKTRLPDVNFDAVELSPLLKNKENIWFKVARLFLVAPSPKTICHPKKMGFRIIK